MILLKLIAELQANPRNINVLRELAKHYQNKGMKNEADAFNYLIEKKYETDSSNSDKEP